MGFRTEELLGMGDTTLSGNTEVHGTLTVHDNVDFLSQLEVSGELYVDGSATLTGATTIGGSLDVYAFMNIQNGIEVQGGNVGVGSGYGVAGQDFYLYAGGLELGGSSGCTLGYSGTGDAFTMNGNTIATLNDISTGTSGTSGEAGTSGTSGRNNAQGIWDISTAYIAGETVVYPLGGTSYVCVQSNTGEAVTNLSYWAVFGAAGTSGTSGESGTSGVSGDTGADGTSGTSGTNDYDSNYYYDSPSTTLYTASLNVYSGITLLTDKYKISTVVDAGNGDPNLLILNNTNKVNQPRIDPGNVSNVLIGSGIGEYNVGFGGSRNTIIGGNNVALYQGTLNNNVVVGYSAFYSGTGSENNVALGYEAMNHAGGLSSTNSIAVGPGALYHGGKYSVAIGTDALKGGYLGEHNIAIGNKAGYGITNYENDNFIIDSYDRTNLQGYIDNSILYGKMNQFDTYGQTLNINAYTNVKHTLVAPVIQATTQVDTVATQWAVSETDIQNGSFNFGAYNVNNNDDFMIGSTAFFDQTATDVSAIYMTTGDTMIMTGNVEVTGTLKTPTSKYNFQSSLSITVGSTDFPTLADTILWLADGNMIGNTTLLLTADNESITDTITINLPYNLAIKGGAYNQTTLSAGTGLSNKPMFVIESNVSFVKVIFDGSTYTDYGSLSTENCIEVNTDDLYIEVKDFLITNFYRGIYSTSNSEFWIMEGGITECYDAGFELNTSSIGAKYRSTLNDYSCTDVNKVYTGIKITSGTTIYLSSENDTSEFEITTGHTFISYNGTQVSYIDFVVVGCIWNNQGNFKSGFDFTLKRDADIVMVSNVGQEDHKPHFKLGWLTNTGVTTISAQNTWYKLNLFATPNKISYAKKFSISGNKVTYFPTHSKDCIMWLNGSIAPSSSVATNWEIAIVKNGLTGTTYGDLQVTTDASGRQFNFGTNVYLSDVIENDYFEIYIRNISSNNVNATCGFINWLGDTR
jgi:hypothetical protein